MSRQIEVRVDGRALRVPAGISVAAAIARAGVAVFQRSVGGEPRGPLCGMGICFECRVVIDGRRDVRSCLAVCSEGMEIEVARA